MSPRPPHEGNSIERATEVSEIEANRYVDAGKQEALGTLSLRYCLQRTWLILRMLYG